jgi:spermidine/putrescine transport system substrate-binding protein
MYSKLSSGAGSYDIVVPSDYMIQKMIQNDMLLPFDATTLSNYGNIGDEFKGKNAYYDPENLYSVPYTYGMLGVIYNTALVDEEDYSEKSWGLMWNEKYRGKILQFNNQRDAFGYAMYYTGLDINTKDKTVWDRALAKLKEQKPLLQGYVNDEIFNKMTTASAAIAPYFAGDFLIMAEQNEDLDFFYPKEGTNYFVDAMCIPKNANYPEVAKEYINFMLSEEPAVANALYTYYASPNRVVRESAEYCLKYGGEGGGYIFATSNVPFKGMPPERYAMILDIWKEHRKY